MKIVTRPIDSITPYDKNPRINDDVAADLTPAQLKAYRIADNQTATLASWDFDILPEEILELKELDYDIDLLGFDDDEMTKIMAGAAG